MTGDDKGERALVRLALLLDEPRIVVGPAPDIDELWDWLHGAIDEPRYAEILSHIAGNPYIYEQWRELRGELADEAEPAHAAVSPATSRESISLTQTRPSTKPWHRWITGWPVGAAGYAALTALLFLNLGQNNGLPEPTLWDNWRQPKSSATDAIDAATRLELRSVLAGVGQQLISLGQQPVGPHGDSLPVTTPACDASDATCPERRLQLLELGKLATSSLMSCQLGAIPELPVGRLTTFEATLSEDSHIVLLRSPLMRWASASPDDALAICAATSTLIERALEGL